jgi:hypothetical protein
MFDHVTLRVPDLAAAGSAFIGSIQSRIRQPSS